ncbi:hypothetical protein D3C76_1475530 [compost metagenome]
MNLGDRYRLVGATDIIHFQDVEADAGTDWPNHVAFFGINQSFGEQGRDLLQLAPAHVTAFQRLGIGRVGDGQLAEVGAAVDFTHQLFSQGFSIVNLRLCRVLRQRDQDVADVHFGIAAVLSANLSRQ